MIADQMAPAMVETDYRAASDSDGNELHFHGRRLYVHASICPSCHEELSESGRELWDYCPFCGRRIKWH